ncbi:putative D-tyrosyl-tRNA(Tyr) deacylase [Hypsibius exemplaris]|uniref:D-aminoacyl-tRNA deacylase n=1 Tax=Hypsibius exemplaris TaxID=2072580 RepID=A0A1W0WUD8_HYPEX|nr:putative D-tyrosyl-tRNA(Tyr) deacylase [Hypsibius exemplaris]
MRAVVQRVLSASVRRGSPEHSHEPANTIQAGLLVLLGIHRDDQSADLEWMVKKILSLRLFDGEDGTTRWKRSVKEMGMEILCISQFTLYGKAVKGSKPDFHDSMAGPESLPMYEEFLSRLGALYLPEKIQRGFFGEAMEIDAKMNGPVTITLDSPPLKGNTPKKPAVPASGDADE